ncbi:argonaute 4A-like protein [Drosera capensis]
MRRGRSNARHQPPETAACGSGASGEHAKRSKHFFRSEVFKVDISYSTKVALQSVSVGPKGSSDGEKQDALRVLDIILRNQAANKYQRSTRAVSVGDYAHHAAKQFGQFPKLDEIKEAPSTVEGVTATETKSIPELPRLNEKVECSMFFC